jgi:conjugal transfer pilin signal peptidase TrbI
MMISNLTGFLLIARALREHARRAWSLYALVAVCFIWTSVHYRVAVNLSNSLPNALYLIDLDAKPEKSGDLVAFEWQRDQFYARDWVMVKRVAGMPGQTVTVKDRSVFVDGRAVGYAKTASRKGIPLEPIHPGVIPNGFLYAESPHPDSLDSRYQVTGLIQASRIIGKAYAIF